MKNIKDGSVDMILCDLPYGTTQNKWDSIINIEDLWAQYNRIIKPNGVIALFGVDLFASRLIVSNYKNYKYKFYWVKDRPSGFLNAKRQPLRNVEEVLIFYKKQPTYNPIFWEGKPLHGMGTKFSKIKNDNNTYREFNSCRNPSSLRIGDTKKYPRQVLEHKRPHPPIHPTQKPVELL